MTLIKCEAWDNLKKKKMLGITSGHPQRAVVVVFPEFSCKILRNTITLFPDKQQNDFKGCSDN